MKLKNTLIIGLATLTLISCNDFLDVDSPSSYNEDFVFSQETEISRGERCSQAEFETAKM